MKWFLASVFTAFALVLGCVTTSHDVLPPDAQTLPPSFQIQSSSDRKSLDYFLLKMGDASHETRVQWWVEFRRANLWREEDPLLACEKFAKLSQAEKFPLRHLSLVRAHQTCAQIPTAPALAPLESVAHLTWLSQPRLEAAWAIAKASNNPTLQFDLLIEKSKISGRPEEKLTLIQGALSLAQQLQDEKRIEVALSRQEKVAPRLTRSPKTADYLLMAQDFKRAREFEQAKLYFQKSIQQKKISLSMRLAALRGLAQTFKMERNKTAYLETLEKITKLTAVSRANKNSAALKLHHEAVVNFARALWTEDSLTQAKQLLEKKAQFFQKRFPRGEIFWLLGRMSEEARDFPSAVEWFQHAAKELPAQAELQEKVLWYLAWNLRNLKRWDEAKVAMTQGRDQALSEFSRARFQYWLARTLAEGDHPNADESKRAYEDLIQMDPLGYYGLLAHHDLKRPIRRAPPPARGPSMPSRLKEILDMPVFEWLIAVEEPELGQVLLDDASEALRRLSNGGTDDVTWSDLLNAYARTGSYQQLFERLGKIPAQDRQAILAQHPQLLFPQPYREVVMGAAEQQSLPSELLFAIMRQESSFNPHARSPADAFGLMQLLPEVAVHAAPVTQVHYQKTEDLYIPNVNIPIGAYHIRQLWNRFKGQFILAVASYNASERVIMTWMRMRYHGDTTTFIEDIPYEETRGYIRLVMRNMIFYQLLNSSSGQIDFPAWVLELTPLPQHEQ